MKNLSQLIMEIISASVDEFSKTISDEYGIENKELQVIWSRIINENHITPTKKKSTPTKKESTPTKKKSTPTKKKSTPTKKKSTPTKTPTKKEQSGCPYTFTKGKKEGCICGSNAKSGKTYCSRHKKYEGQSPKKKKKRLPERKSIVNTKRGVVKKKPESIVLHKGPDNYFHHRPTGLVFNTERVAIGTWSKADIDPSGKDQIVSLTKENIEQAKKFGFQYKEVEEDVVEEDVVEEDVVEEDVVEEDVVEETSIRHVTRDLLPDETKKLKLSLSSAISKTNLKAQDVTDILNELQTNCDVEDLSSEVIDNESDLEEE